MSKTINDGTTFRSVAATNTVYTATCRADVGGDLHQKFFLLHDDAGSVGFWFDVDAAGAPAPATGAARDVKIDTVTTGMTAIQVAAALYAVIIADAKFKPGQDFLDGHIDVASEIYGPLAAGVDGDTAFTIGTSDGVLVDDATIDYIVDDLLGYSCQIVWTSATCTGTLKVQESNDGGTSWTDLAGAAATFNNNNGNVILHAATAMRFVERARLKLDITAGGLTGLVCHFHAKG